MAPAFGSEQQTAKNADMSIDFSSLTTGLETSSEQSAPQGITTTSVATPNSPEQAHILNQVIEKLSVGHPNIPDRITIKMTPEELGEVTLDLVMDKDHLRVQLSAQNTQVQELLQKHLPRLEEALQNQNLQPDELRVSVDDRGQGHEGFSRHDRKSPTPQPFSRAMPDDTGQAAPLTATSNAAQGLRQGLSLRI
jgi:flagellar hook-length control protein FliK